MPFCEVNQMEIKLECIDDSNTVPGFEFQWGRFPHSPNRGAGPQKTPIKWILDFSCG